MEAIRLLCMDTVSHQWIRVAPANGRLRALLYQQGNVLRECSDESGDLLLEVEITDQNLEFIQREEGVILKKGPDKQIINSCG
jgi:hypothetical protein